MMNLTRKNSDTMFSYEPVRFVKNQSKKSPEQLKKIYENKIALAEHNLFNSRDLLQRKINKVNDSIHHITDKLSNISNNVFYETTLYGKLSILKVQLFRLQNRFDFLNKNADIIPYLSSNPDDLIHFEESI